MTHVEIIAKGICPNCKMYFREEESFDYDDYAPEAAALMKVEILDPEEKTGPSLGRVLGTLFIL